MCVMSKTVTQIRSDLVQTTLSLNSFTVCLYSRTKCVFVCVCVHGERVFSHCCGTTLNHFLETMWQTAEAAVTVNLLKLVLNWYKHNVKAAVGQRRPAEEADPDPPRVRLFSCTLRNVAACIPNVVLCEDFSKNLGNGSHLNREPLSKWSQISQDMM